MRKIILLFGKALICLGVFSPLFSNIIETGGEGLFYMGEDKTHNVICGIVIPFSLMTIGLLLCILSGYRSQKPVPQIPFKGSPFSLILKAYKIAAYIVGVFYALVLVVVGIYYAYFTDYIVVTGFVLGIGLPVGFCVYLGWKFYRNKDE